MEKKMIFILFQMKLMYCFIFKMIKFLQFYNLCLMKFRQTEHCKHEKRFSLVFLKMRILNLLHTGKYA